MLKSIQWKLVKIKYNGNSIGDDIRLEVEILGKFLQIDTEIKAGKTAVMNQEIGKFETDQETFRAGVLITIIEKDLLFNDIGRASGNLKINTTITEAQQFVFQSQIKETRSVLGKIWGKRKAYFEITLEAEVSNPARYVPDLDESQGFLTVKLEDKKSEVELPAYLKVRLERASATREYLTILEGPYRGKAASVEFQKNGSSWFIADVNHEPMIQAEYSISQKIFTLNGKKYKTTDYPTAPWQKGIYDIEIPDCFHRGGRNYLDRSKRAGTWLRISHGGARYLHAGGYSLGCMTVIEVSRWMEIYNALIKARKGDFMSVGILEVSD